MKVIIDGVEFVEKHAGDRNTGNRNTGDYNAGDYNTGDYNTGDWNAGDRNTGDWNMGDWNVGGCNTGNRNTGDWNTGNRNTGNRNTGDWNSGDRNTGYFNLDEPDKIRVFGKNCDREKWEMAHKPDFLFFDLTIWISSSDMTEEEKIDNPSHATTGGYLKKLDYKEAFKASWDAADKEDRIRVKDLPNFDKEIFRKISGIDVDED